MDCEDANMSTVRVIRIRNNTGNDKEWVKTFQGNEEFQIPDDSVIYYKYKSDNNLLIDIANGDASIGNGAKYFTNVREQLFWLIGVDQIIGRDSEGRLRIVMGYEHHAVSHQKDGVDELNVVNLLGLLADAQHPIPSECIDAMGTKANTNPLHHDRYQQSEIHDLQESQLSLNYSTHDNSNDPSTAQKQAMNNASSPATGNPFVTVSDLESYSETDHTHANLPTNDEKAALAGNSPNSSNKYATMDDIANIDNSQIAQNFSSLPSSPDLNAIWKTLEDEVISTDTYEAGWYQYLGSGNGGGEHGSDWKFYSTMEDHTHTWSQVSKSGSKASDISDVPSYPSDGNENELIEEDGVLSWKPRSTGSGTVKRTAQLTLIYQGSTSSQWLKSSDSAIKTNECGVIPPFNCRVREVAFTNKHTGSTSQVNELRAHYRDRSDTSYFSTSDPVEWFANNAASANLLYNEGDGKRWAYDCTNDNDEMLTTRAYAFRFQRTYGRCNMDDIHIIVTLEEI